MVHPELAAIEVDGTERSDILMKYARPPGDLRTRSGQPLREGVRWDGGKQGDVEILNYALTLEYLESVYAEALKKAGLSGDLEGLVKPSRPTKMPYVKALTQTIRDLEASRSRRPRSSSMLGHRRLHGAGRNDRERRCQRL